MSDRIYMNIPGRGTYKYDNYRIPSGIRKFCRWELICIQKEKKCSFTGVFEKKRWKSLVISLGISLGVEVLSGLLTRGSMDTYDKIYKPPLSPPGWVFPVVWTLLFVLMGISSWLVFIQAENKHVKEEELRGALSFYGIQLLVNMGWSVIFFVFHAYLLAFAWLLLLWYLVFVTAYRFYRISPLAGKLMIPYLGWLTFAAYLNLAIVLHYWDVL